MKIDPFPGELTKQLVRYGSGRGGAAWKIVLTDEQREWFCRWFPEEENGKLMKMSGMSHSTLHRLAREYKLTKSADGMKRIKKHQTRNLMRTCEKNGYYDSLRGKPVSEATRQGVARMWQEVRDGKRKHPFQTFKLRNPKRFHECMMARGASLKETYRKERLRVKWGLEQKTKLNILPDGYTKKRRAMTMHRYLFRRFNYIVDFGSNDVYYDEETDRRPRMEANAHKFGLKVLPINT